MVVGGITLYNFTKHDLFFAINGRYSDIGNVIMYYITWMGQAQIIIPVLVLLMLFPMYRNRRYFLTAMLCNVVPFLILYFIKDWLNRPRPRLLYKDDPGIHCCDNWEKLLHSSFPSGHSQGAFTFFCFLSLLLFPKYRAFGFVFFLLALAVGYSRIYLAAHFFDDVYVGSIIGVVGTSVSYLFMTYKKGPFTTSKPV